MIMILWNCQRAPVQCLWAGRRDSKGRVQTESTSTNPLFSLSLCVFAHWSACVRHAPALPKRWAWRGKGTETPVPTLWPFIFSPVSQLFWLKALFEDFCSIWVGSKCLSKSLLKAPSCAAQFDLLVLKSQRDISVHLESSFFTATPFTVFDPNRIEYSVHMCKY